MGNLSTQPQESQGSGWATSRASLGNCLWVPESPRGLSLVGRMVWAQREGTGEAAVGPGNTRSAKAVRDPNTTLMPASAGQTWGRLCGEPTFFPWGPPGEKAGADWSTAPQRRRKRQRRPRHVCADRRGWGPRGRGADCPEPVEAGGGHAVREGAGTWVRKGQGPGVPAAERRWGPVGVWSRFWPRGDRVGAGFGTGPRGRFAVYGDAGHHAGQRRSEGPAWGSRE